MFRRPQMSFQAALSRSSTDISSASVGAESNVGAASDAGAGSGVIDWVVSGTGFFCSAVGATWCASVRLGIGF